MKKLYSNTYLMRFLTAQLPSLALFVMILSNQAWKKLVKHHNLVNVKTYLNLLKAFRIKNTGCFFCSPQIFVTRWYLKLIQIWLFLINLSNTKWWSERGWIFDSIHLLWNMIYLLIRWMNTSRVKYSIIGTDFLVYFCL